MSRGLAVVSIKGADGDRKSSCALGERLPAATSNPNPDSLGFPMRSQNDALELETYSVESLAVVVWRG
jgi:hypothetical protein